MEVINLHETFKNQRDIDANETLALLKSYGRKFWSWGAHAFIRIGKKALRFKSEGHHHKGHVYISVSGLDLYDVHIATLKGEIKKEITGLYFDQLFDAIDKEIEYIPEYKGN